MKAVEHLHFTRQTVKELKAEIARLRAALEEVIAKCKRGESHTWIEQIARKALANKRLMEGTMHPIFGLTCASALMITAIVKGNGWEYAYDFKIAAIFILAWESFWICVMQLMVKWYSRHPH